MNCRTSSYAPRFLAVAAIAMLVVALSAVPAHAQGFQFADFSSPTNLTLNGNAAQVGNVLRLTPATASQVGSAWYSTKQPIAGGFTAVFQFQLWDGGGIAPTADGIAFVIQNSATSALGGAGGAIGYGGTVSAGPPFTDGPGGIPASIAFEFDTYPNGWDPDGNHLGIQSCGAAANTSDHTHCAISPAAPVTPQLATSGNATPITHTAFITYVPTCSGNISPNLTVALDSIDNVVMHACVNLSTLGVLDASGKAYVGFTGATGGAYENNDILNVEFVTPITDTLQGNSAVNRFVFPFAEYDVTYPADVPVSNTTMTITPTVLSPADCLAEIVSIQLPPSAATPTPANTSCTTFANLTASGNTSNVYNLSAIFDVACSVGGAAPTSAQCPTTNGYDPFIAGGFHGSEDVTNTLIYATHDGTTGTVQQFLTAMEGTTTWIPIGVGFSGPLGGGDPSKGGGTSSFNSLMVSVNFPSGATQFAIPTYQFIGFASPVGNAPGNLNSAQAGQTIPFKWQVNYPSCAAANLPANCPIAALGFNGGPVTNLNFAPNGYLTLGVIGVCNNSSDLSIDDDIPVDTESQTGLANQGNGVYQYNWKTPKTFDGLSLAGQCLEVAADVGDGQSHEADFQFHK